MSSIIHYDHCPVCGSRNFKIVIRVKDHSVSGQSFDIAECAVCSLRFTQDVPDQDAIGSYYKSENYISHTNTGKGLINQLYQKVRRRTLSAKKKLVTTVTGIDNGKLLDIGSGTGAFVHTMKEAGWQVTGLEPDIDARLVAKKDFGVELDDISLFKSIDGPFDAITLWHVLEHVHDLNGYISRIRDLLKEKGKLFIAVPNYTSQDAEIYKEYWAAYDVPRHLYHFSPAAMKMLVEKHGMQINSYKPMWYDSFYVSMLGSKYKNGRTNLAGSFLSGLKSNWNAKNDFTKCSSVIYIIEK